MCQHKTIGWQLAHPLYIIDTGNRTSIINDLDFQNTIEKLLNLAIVRDQTLQTLGHHYT